MSDRTALAQLTTCLRGDLPVAPNWMALLVLANRALVTPQLYRAMEQSGAIGQLPEDVRKFLLVVSGRNRERNRRLSVQLGETLRALNSAGIEPVLLKGAGVWASSGTETQFDRIVSDIDLMVKPTDAEHAIAVLEQHGSRCLARYPEEMHVVAELGRPDHVGAIDLHRRPPGPVGIAHIPDLDARCTRISWFGGNALLPAPALQIFFLILHDQFHDGGYWRGGFDLRHLLDIGDLAQKSQPADWLALDDLCRTSLVRNARDAQLIAAERLAGAAVPQRFTRRRWARAQHRRHVWQFAYPKLSPILALGAVATEWANLLAYEAVKKQHPGAMLGPKAEAEKTLVGRIERRIKRLRRSLSPRAGKL